MSWRIGLGANIFDEMNSIRMKGDIRPDKRHYSAIIEPRHRDLISILCAEEIRLFGYRFEDRAGGARDRKPGVGVA